MSQAGQIAGEGSVLPVNVPIDFVTDDGIATADNNILNVIGGPGTSTTGSGNTVTITSFEPNATFLMYEDFIPHFTENGGLGSGLWGWDPIATYNADPIAGHPGLVYTRNASIGAGGVSGVQLISDSPTGFIGMFLMGGGEITLNWVIKIDELSNPTNRYELRCGLADGNIIQHDFANGIYFSYSDNVNSGNWVLTTMSSNVTTTVNSSIAATTNWVNLCIVINAAGTSCSFFVDGVSAGASIGTIPSVGLMPTALFIRSSGAMPENLIDLFYMRQNLTTAR